MHLERSLVYDGPWLQLLPDSPEDCERLEVLACAGIRTGGPATEPEQQWLLTLMRKLLDSQTRGDG